MEKTPVLIVGAGPSGLALALSLAKFKVHSVILEKEQGVTQDPRGVVIAGDAVRIVHGLGIDLDKIGHVPHTFSFHKSTLLDRPYYSVDISKDDLHQVVPQYVAQMQPVLETALRDLVSNNPYCDLREGREVTGRTELANGSVIVQYHHRYHHHTSPNTEKEGEDKEIKASFLIGADGKRGIVRKHFLEPTAGIRQETGLFAYEGTWIAANIKITPPTPETHPDFPLWKLNQDKQNGDDYSGSSSNNNKNYYTPDQVYNLFWPRDWHFLSPAGGSAPVACGRFGREEDRVWRHEMAISSSEAEADIDSEKTLLDNLLPMLTRTTDEHGRPFPSDVLQQCEGGAVSFPRDCFTFVRCRPFQFAQKVVNRWFHRRTILIGDAAHVFPPFAGQGIACGVRDAHGLAWRLALLLGRIGDDDDDDENDNDIGVDDDVDSDGDGDDEDEDGNVSVPMKREDWHLIGQQQHQKQQKQQLFIDTILVAWARERRRGVDDATMQTKANGELCNAETTRATMLWFGAVGALRSLLPVGPLKERIPPTIAFDDRRGYMTAQGGFFSASRGGGGKLAQVFVRSLGDGDVVLSDELLRPQQNDGSSRSLMTLLIMGQPKSDLASEVSQLITQSGINPKVLSSTSICFVDASCPKKTIGPVNPSGAYEGQQQRAYSVVVAEDLPDWAKRIARPGYDAAEYAKRLGASTKFALVRPDSIVFATAFTMERLGKCVEDLGRMMA